MLGSVAAVALAGVLASSLVAPTEDTGSISYLAYDTHPVGMPVTTDPAQTVASASGALRDDSTSAFVHVTLGATPDASNDAELHLVFGTADDVGGCTPHTDIVAPTAGSSTVDLSGDVAPLAPGARGCTYVAVVDPSTSAVLDRVDGGTTGGVIVDPIWMRLSVARHKSVPVDRWSWVSVRVWLAEPADQLRVDGHPGPGVRSRDAVQRDVAAGWVRVRLPVKLLLHRSQKLVLRASTGHADNSTVVRLKPRG